MNFTIAYFLCDTQNGNELFKLLSQALQSLSSDQCEFCITKYETTQMAVLESCFCDDIIVFDGSLEDGFTEHYNGAYELLKSLDYFLLVSRTEIPFNFDAIRKGGYPKLITTGLEPITESLDNDSLVEWIIGNIKDGSMELPRKYKMTREEFHRLRLKPFKLIDFEREMLDWESKKARANSKSPQVFVSYISKYSTYYNKPLAKKPPYNLEDCIRFMCKHTNISLDDVGYFPPAKLSSELMTIQRRWEIVSVTYELINASKQVWIFNTPDYFESWWTISELIILSYIFKNNPEDCPDIYVANPYREGDSWKFRIGSYTTNQQKESFLPQLSGKFYDEIVRLFVNSRKGTVALESQTPMQLVSKMPGIVKYGLFLGSKIAMKKMHIESGDDTESQYTYEKYKQSVGSYAYTPSFWNDLVIECPTCKNKYFDKWNLESFVYPTNTDFCHVINADLLQSKDNPNEFIYICEKCKQSFEFYMGHYYRWWTIRANKQTGPNGKSIEKKPTLYFK